MATVYVYFTSEIEEKTGEGGFLRNVGRANDPHHLFHGARIFQRKGGWITSEFDLGDEIPESIREFMTHATFESYFYQGHRERGVYKNEEEFGDAIAELDVTSQGNHSLSIRGTSLLEMKALHDAIRAGIILPCISWETKQEGVSSSKRITLQGQIDEMSTRIDGVAGEIHDTGGIRTTLKELSKRLKSTENRWFWINWPRIKEIIGR